MSGETDINGFNSLNSKALVFTIVGLQLTLLLAALDQNIVSAAMPRIIGQLNGFERYAWVTTAYLLTSTAAIPVFGRLSDIYGRKWFLLGGAALFTITSAFCGAAGHIKIIGAPVQLMDGMSQLIFFRGLQGLGGGIIMSVVFSVIGDLFPPAQRGKYVGLTASVWAIASIIGPALGGWLTDQLSWRWIFFVNLPVGVLAIAVLYYSFPYFRPIGVHKKIDYAGIITLIAFMVPFLLGLTWANSAGWTSPRVIALLVFSLLMMFLFYWCEKNALEPIMPPSLLRMTDVRLSIFILCCSSIGMFAAVLFVPLFLQVVLNATPTQTGYLLIPQACSISLAASISGQIVSRWGRYKSIAIAGIFATIVGLFLLSRINSNTEFSTLLWLMVLIGTGLGFSMPIFTVVVQNSAPPNMMGAATGISQFWRSMGATLGAAILGEIMQVRYAEHLRNSNLPALSLPLLKELQNPAHLTQIKQQLISTYGQTTGDWQRIQTVFNQVNESLIYSLNHVFIWSMMVMILALLACFALKEKELRGK